MRVFRRFPALPDFPIALRCGGLQALLCLSLPCSAQWHTAGPLQSYQALSPCEVVLKLDGASVRVALVGEGIARIALTPDGVREQRASWAVPDEAFSAPQGEIADQGERITISGGGLRVEIGKHPLRIRFTDASGRPFAADEPEKGLSWTATESRVWKSIRTGERFYGFGEKSGSLERSGTHMSMWNSDIPGYSAQTDPLYKSVPFFYASADSTTYGIFLDNTSWSSFDMGKEGPREYSFGSHQQTLVYYVLLGPQPRDVLKRYLTLVGSTLLPPRWSLGYQQCRWSYTPEARVRQIAESFRSREIPCDVIYLDIDYMDGYRIFTWNPVAFPEPGALVRDLSADGFKVAVILDPGIKVDSAYQAYTSGLSQSVFLRYPDGSMYTGDVWPGRCAFPDFTDPNARRWWGEQLGALVQTGIRGWWTDMNEPSVFNVPSKTIDRSVIHHGLDTTVTHAVAHNVYGMEMTHATVDGVHAKLPEERVFVLTRATFAGGQRYAAVWTGDNLASWDHLAIGVRMCLNLSISGFAFVGTDIGGFIGYPSGELFARWLQFGAFTPLMRAHSQIHEPDKEPWAYGEPWTTINRGTIALRYRLLPYLYTAMQEASSGGSPPMRPMHYVYPEQQRFATTEGQFMFGDDLLVAPVLRAGARMWEVHLPAGLWYDFWTGESQEGGRTLTVKAPPDHIPVFVRAGASIPLQPLMQYVGQRSIDTLTLNVYLAPQPGARDSSLYYEDDGQSLAYKKGEYFRRYHVQKMGEESVEIHLTEASGTYNPPSRAVRLEVFGLPFAPQSVTVNNRAISVSDTLAGPESEGWAYTRHGNVLRGVFPDSRLGAVIRVHR